jgi:hypothetical protein
VAALDSVRRFAEEPYHELPEPWLPGRRIIRPRFTLALSPSPTLASLAHLRTTPADLDDTIAEARGILRAHGYVACGWYIGPSSEPSGVERLLVERGFRPATRPPFEPGFTAMTLTREPPVPPVAPGVEARPVRTLDEYRAALRVGLVAHGESEEAIAKWVDAAAAGWDHPSGLARMTHVAFADGEVAGLGMVTYGLSAVFLAGGAVLAPFRGRGVYRALVASRWRAAVALGKPALAVQAGAMSRPILARCGFEEVCRLEVLLDPEL